MRRLWVIAALAAIGLTALLLAAARARPALPADIDPRIEQLVA